VEESEWLADRFEEHRARLRAVAYRMLGSLTEADDAVQDTWLRLSRSGAGEVDNLGGWLTTIVARVCLNMLRSRNLRREESLGVHLPDPLISPAGELQPEEEALLADSVGLALLVVLDTLAPAERLAFVLHDMFELPFEEIAPMVGRTPAAARQLASRARRRVKGADVPQPPGGQHPPRSPTWQCCVRVRASGQATRLIWIRLSSCTPTGSRPPTPSTLEYRARIQSAASAVAPARMSVNGSCRLICAGPMPGFAVHRPSGAGVAR